jgi:hypothetical protein
MILGHNQVWGLAYTRDPCVKKKRENKISHVFISFTSPSRRIFFPSPNSSSKYLRHTQFQPVHVSSPYLHTAPGGLSVHLPHVTPRHLIFISIVLCSQERASFSPSTSSLRRSAGSLHAARRAPPAEPPTASPSMAAFSAAPALVAQAQLLAIVRPHLFPKLDPAWWLAIGRRCSPPCTSSPWPTPTGRSASTPAVVVPSLEAWTSPNLVLPLTLSSSSSPADLAVVWFGRALGCLVADRRRPCVDPGCWTRLKAPSLSGRRHRRPSTSGSLSRSTSLTPATAVKSPAPRLCALSIPFMLLVDSDDLFFQLQAAYVDFRNTLSCSILSSLFRMSSRNLKSRVEMEAGCLPSTQRKGWTRIHVVFADSAPDLVW